MMPRTTTRTMGCVALLCAIVAARAADDGATIIDFDIPEYNDVGVMTSRIKGDSAKVMTNGFIEVYGLTMEFYKEADTNRAVEMRVASPRCLLNRDKKAAVSDSDVRISRDNMVVTGTGFLWNNNDQVLKIMTNSRVVLKGARRNMKTEQEIP